MEPTNEGGIVKAESESEQLEGEIGEDEAEAEKEEEVEEADRHQLLLELNLHLSGHKIMKSHSFSISPILNQFPIQFVLNFRDVRYSLRFTKKLQLFKSR